MSTIDKILDILNQKGMTPYELCKGAKISTGNFTDWKNHKAEPSLRSLRKIADFLHISIYDLMDKRDEPVIDNKSEEVPEEIVLLARKMDKIDPEQRKRIYKLLDSTIDGVLEALDAEDRHPPRSRRG